MCVRVCVCVCARACMWQRGSSYDLEFSGAQIHWPLLVNQLRVQVGHQVATHIKLRVLVSPPASS